ncbi:phosphoribosylaminoimidazole carboxylase [Polaribacter cellanae]|uniref:Phosphoribosylaminoimidazole carboxylase n=1 Tax=Polaribacter cellanae TaxID=2818493 RepID=A0A975H620_9FLAO|nr:phosphoribosylaminoimidazole carboxylase [Polaribacter cellanae]QTE22006.1 phosphoribosylaminoimidazole carboxylase [Polaribacter cellanae]
MLKKIFFFSILLALFNCENNDILQGCIRPAPLSISSDLNNPQLINALVPGGFAELNGGYKGILLLNVNGKDFVAYDRICPANDCKSAMTYERGIVLKCKCDGSEYGVGKAIGGTPQTEGFNCAAIEYKVTKIGSVIRITNF